MIKDNRKASSFAGNAGETPEHLTKISTGSSRCSIPSSIAFNLS